MGRLQARSRMVLSVALLALCYTVVGKLSLSLDAVSGFATLVWPPTGLALAAVLVSEGRLTAGVLLGAWLVNVWAGASAITAFGIAVGNTLEAVVAVAILRRVFDVTESITRLRHVIGLILGASVVSTAVSASIGVLSLWLGGVVHSIPQAMETWRAWWVGDVFGDLVVAPFLLVWWPFRKSPRMSRWQVAELLASMVLVGIAARMVFFRHAVVGRSIFESPYVLFPLFAWAALRFELLGASLATGLASLLAIWGTARGLGPFAHARLAIGLLGLQTFMACAAVTPLVIAGAIMDRERALRMHKNLVAAVSHDLRNPLNAILMSGEVLARKVPEAPVQEHHRLVTRAVGRMTRLVSDLVDAAALEAGALGVETKPEDMRALLEDVLALMHPIAAAKSQSVRALVSGSEAMLVRCDRDRIQQVLSNVIGNGIKFSPAASTITITVARERDHVLVSVQDSGIGIADDELRHVFDRYWHTRASVGGGSGLGLGIAKGIVEAHGGRMWAESTRGTGSTFFFTLPAVRP